MYSDKDWNEWARDEIEKHGKQAPGLTKYLAAKMLGERAAWEFMVQHKPSYDLVYVLPTWTFGPVIHEVPVLHPCVSRLPIDATRRHPPFPISLSRFLFSSATSRTQRKAHLVGIRVSLTYATSRACMSTRRVAPISRDADSSPPRLSLLRRRTFVSQLSTARNTNNITLSVDVYYSLPVSERPKMPEPVPRGQPGKGDKVRASLSSFTPESSWEVFQWETRSFPEVVKDTLCSLVDRGLLEK